MNREPVLLSQWASRRDFREQDPSPLLTRLKIQWGLIIGELAPLCEPLRLDDDGKTLWLRFRAAQFPPKSSASLLKLKAILELAVLSRIRDIIEIHEIHWEDGDPPDTVIDELFPKQGDNEEPVCGFPK